MPARPKAAGKKRRVGRAAPGLSTLSPELRVFRDCKVRASVEKETAKTYAGLVAKVQKYGKSKELSYQTCMRYLKDCPPSVHCAITKRQALSAVFYEAYCAGEPIDDADADDLGLVVDAMEVEEGERTKRGALDEEMFGELLTEVKARGQAWAKEREALEVQFGLCCRGPSAMPFITVCDVDFRRKTVEVMRKGSGLTKCRNGEKVTQPIYTKEAFDILQRRCSGKEASDKVFPEWDAGRLGDLIRYCADSYGWARKKNVKFDGTHVIRHAAAMQCLEDSLEAVRKRGGWDTQNSARWYSRLNRG